MLGRVFAMEWMYGVNLLETAICVTGNLSANVGRGYPASAHKQGIGVTFKHVIILHIIQSGINMSSISETVP